MSGATDGGPEGRHLQAGYRIEPFDHGDPARVEELIEVWVANGALHRAAARERVRDALFAAYAPTDAMAGVATAYLAEGAHLGMRLWNYRTYVEARHREGDIAFLLLHRTRDHLRDRYADGSDRRGAGMLIEVQNPILKRARAQGVWATSRFAFIGEDERGAHHRVFYFPGAEAPLPPERPDGHGAPGWAMEGSVAY